MLDRVPYRMLISALFVPGPLIIAAFLGGTPTQIVLAPLGGALVGSVVAYWILRDHKLPFGATWADVRFAMKRKNQQS